jgi:hypothetical protein
MFDNVGFPLFQQMQKTKRIRTAFSPQQLAHLEHAFQRSKYIVGSERKHLAKQLLLSETQVMNDTLYFNIAGQSLVSEQANKIKEACRWVVKF